MKQYIQEILQVLREVKRRLEPIKHLNRSVRKEEIIDGIATDTLRKGLNQLSWRAKIALGEGEKDEMPGLFQGEVVGKRGKILFEIALDPISGTRVLKDPQLQSPQEGQVISALALAPKGAFYFPYPGIQRLFRIAVPGRVKNIFPDSPILENLKNISETLKCDLKDLTVVVVSKRHPYNSSLVTQLQKLKIKTRVVRCQLGLGITILQGKLPRHVLYGVSGGIETVILAAAARCTNGTVVSAPENDFNIVHYERDLVKQPCGIAAIGITSGPISASGLILVENK